MTEARSKLNDITVRYGSAILAVALATVVRLALDRALGPRLPLAPYLITVILVASFAGFGPGLIATVLGGALGGYLFLAPSGGAFAGSAALNLISYAVLCVAICVVVKLIQDARRRAERSALALAENEQRLTTILSNIGDAVIAVDNEGRVTFINDVARSLTGFHERDVSGKPIQELFELRDEITQQAADPVTSALTGGAPEDHSRHELITKQGGTIPVEDKCTAIPNAAGEICGAVIVFRDITQRKLVEQALREKDQQFRTIADTAPVMLWLADADGLRSFFNQSWLDFTGRTMEAEAGYGWADGIHPDDLRPCLEQYTAAVKARARFSVEYRLRQSNGEYHWVLDSGIPRHSSEGEFIGLAGSCADISDRKSSEEASRFLASIVRSSEDGIYGKTLEGIVLSWNAASERIYGYTAEEIIGKNISILAPPDRLDEVAHVFDTLKSGESIPHLETHRMTKDGRIIDVALTISPMHDETGRITGASTIVRDITERKRADQERIALTAQVEQERARLDNVVANVPGVVWEAWGKPDDALQRIDFVSDYVEKMLGYSVEEWLSTPNFWLSIVHSDDQERAAREAAAIFAGGKGGTSRFRWIAKDRRVLWVEAQSLVVRDDAEKPIGMRGVTMDISERKRSEDSQRFLAEASGLLAASLDYETTLNNVARLAVPTLADWCTLHILEEGGRLRQLAVAHSDPAKVEAALELRRRFPMDLDAPIGVPNVLRTGRSEFYPQINEERLELAVRNKELAKILRREHLKSCMIVPLVARNRTLGALTLVTAESERHYDQTDLVLAEDLAHRIALAVDNARLYREAQDAVTAREEALVLRDDLLKREHNAREEAEAANRTKDEFLATVSHELRTPLNAILGWAHMLSDNKLDRTTQARALETIERNAKSQAQLIDDILDVSRIVTGKLRLDVRPIEVASVVEAAIDAVRPAADAKAIRIQTILDPRAGAVSGDPDRLQQVVWNLAANAVKFTGKGGRVQVRLERANSHIEIIVSDTGQGISADFLPYVFDRFRQADATSTRLHGGLGLGLAIVRHLVEMHGGSVQADSPGEGKGSTFTVQLPLMIVHRELEHSTRVHPASGGSVAAAQASALEDLNVLIVDDELDTLAMLKLMVEGVGARVRACASAGEALSALQEWKPDVMVSDIEMPGEDGYQLIGKIRQLGKGHGGEIPAVALTAYARAEDRVRALSAGYQMHLAKPFEPAELIAVIASLAGRNVKGSVV